METGRKALLMFVTMLSNITKYLRNKPGEETHKEGTYGPYGLLLLELLMNNFSHKKELC